MQPIMNETTEKSVRRYLGSVEKRSVVLSGKRHMGKHMCAEYIARKILGVGEDSNLFLHPDFSEISPDKKGSIGVEQVRQMLEQAEMCSVRAEKRIILVDDADTMSVSAQNALLKVLEDDADRVIFIFVAHNQLISTILSRCAVIEFKPVSVSAENEVLAVLADGCPGAVSAYAKSTLLEKAERLAELYTKMSDRREILMLLGQVKEKDREEFFSAHSREEVMAFFELLEYLFTNALLWKSEQVQECRLREAVKGVAGNYSQEEIISVLDCIQCHKRSLQFGKYNKNDFFELCVLLGGRI